MSETYSQSGYITQNRHSTAIPKGAVILILCIWIISPIIGSSILYIYIYYKIRTIKACVFASFFVGVTFGLLSYSAEQGGSLTCDLLRYRDQYITYVGRPYGELFSPNILFDSINWIFANYLTSEPRWIGFFWVTLSVFSYLTGCTLFITSVFKGRNDDVFFISGFACLAIIPFVIVNELLKQTAAVSLILLALALSFTGRKGVGILTLFSVLIHISSTVLFFPLLFWKCKFVHKWIYVIVPVSICIGMVNIIEVFDILFSKISIFKIIGLSAALENYASFDEWGGSKRFYISFGFYAAQLVYISLHCNKHLNGLNIILLLVFCIIMMNFSNNHNFARLVNTIYPFNALALIVGLYVSKGVSKRMLLAIFTTLCLFLSTVIQFRSNVANNYYMSYMNNDLLKIVTSNITDFLSL